jgi:hypothetical protein
MVLMRKASKPRWVHNSLGGAALRVPVSLPADVAAAAVVFAPCTSMRSALLHNAHASLTNTDTLPCCSWMRAWRSWKH